LCDLYDNSGQLPTSEKGEIKRNILPVVMWWTSMTFGGQHLLP
jgi:hypothetical protein